MCTKNFVIIRPVVLLITLLMLFGCKDDPIEEVPLKISLDAPAYAIVPGAEFTFKLTVESLMPPSGVLVGYEVKEEVTGYSVTSWGNSKVSDKVSSYTISFLPRQVICVCTVKVQSAGDKANTATTSFRVVYK